MILIFSIILQYIQSQIEQKEVFCWNFIIELFFFHMAWTVNGETKEISHT